MTKAWEPLALPVGPQELPAWACGLFVEWMPQYSNPPSFRLKTNSSFSEWPNQYWVEPVRGRYVSESGDGRCQIHFHSGRVFEEDGKWVTEKQQGYAGRGFDILMGGDHALAGKTLTLRGPWRGGTLDGYEIVYAVDMDDEYAKRRAAKGEPWHRATATFGTEISRDILLKLIAKHYPHLRVGLVTATYSFDKSVHQYLSPYPENWGAPKEFVPSELWKECA